MMNILIYNGYSNRCKIVQNHCVLVETIKTINGIIFREKGFQMKKASFFGAAVLILLWHFAAVSIGNDVLIPYPLSVAGRLIELLKTPTLYASVFHTVIRVARGFTVSIVTALIFSILSDRYPLFRQLFHPLQLMLRTVPNASYIILAIIWLGSEGSVAAVSFMILFPLFYNSFMNKLDHEERALKDVDLIYPESFTGRLRYRTMPLLLDEVLETGKTGASMGLKVGVMAEIIGAVRIGIGRQMSLARIYLETDRLLAWTLVIIFVSILSDQLFSMLIRLRKKEEQRWRN